MSYSGLLKIGSITKHPCQEICKSFPRWETLEDHIYGRFASSHSRGKSLNFSLYLRIFIKILIGSFDEVGQWVSGFHKKFGPKCHLRLLINSSADKPRDASSAGFNRVGMRLQCDGELTSRILATRFATNVWNLLSTLEIYPSTQVLSVQNSDASIGISISLRIMLSSLVATTAADNLRRGIFVFFNGANLDLLLTNEQWTSFSWFVNRK